MPHTAPASDIAPLSPPLVCPHARRGRASAPTFPARRIHPAMTTTDVLQRLAPLIQAHAGQPPADTTELASGTRLESDLRMDSMAVVHVLEDIEEQFDVTIPDEQLAVVYTVGDLVNIVLVATETTERAA
ncbi:acyl carrier protein [Streptomyces sp. NPDC007088]|uniref:acyl carrier protein n=1 Tax=Streptomyces sp. NPDC007088 TaxID=3364773 RepID=UPI0036A47DAA